VPAHWTYTDFNPADDLSQGDILQRSPELVALMKSVHAHFCDEKYLAFVVTTQSCDLVQRSERCKAQHVSLAVVRALESVLPSLLDIECGTDVKGVFEAESKGRATELLSRILNQNEQGSGLFYLHPDADSGIAVHSVALLRVTIAFRTAEHLETLKRARVGRLDAQFQSKLGWLAGNLYARVATKDWTDFPGGKARAKGIIEEFLSPEGPCPSHWVPRAFFKGAKKAGAELAGLTPEAAVPILQRHKPKAAKDTVLDKVREEAKKLFGSDAAGPEKIEKLVARLQSDTEVADALNKR
jgi:hypothetical protein